MISTKILLLVFVALFALLLVVALWAMGEQQQQRALTWRLQQMLGQRTVSSQQKVLFKHDAKAGLLNWLKGKKARFYVLGGQALAGKLLIGSCVLSIAVYWLCAIFSTVWALPLALLSLLILPVVCYQYLERRHIELFNQHLIQAVELISRASKAGNSIPVAIQRVAEEAPEPVAEEFRYISNRLHIGVPMETVLDESMQRMPVVSYAFFCVALLINQERGGRIAEVMAELSQTLRAQRALQQKVRTLTSEPRSSAIILAVIPLVMFAILGMVSPTHITFLLQTETGNKMLLYIVCSVLIGFYILNRLTRVRY